MQEARFELGLAGLQQPMLSTTAHVWTTGFPRGTAAAALPAQLFSFLFLYFGSCWLFCDINANETTDTPTSKPRKSVAGVVPTGPCWAGRMGEGDDRNHRCHPSRGQSGEETFSGA